PQALVGIALSIHLAFKQLANQFRVERWHCTLHQRVRGVAALRQHILTMMLKAPETTAAGALAAIVDPTIQEDDVARMPALAIYSGRARLPNIEDMKQSLPNVEATQMTGTVHFVMMENPSEFNRLLTAFLDRISADASERSREQRPR